MNATYIEIALIFVLPIILWASGIVPTKYKAWVLVALGLLVGFFVWVQDWSWVQLGVRLDNLSQSVIPFALLTVVSVLFLFAYGKLHRRRFIPAWVDHQQVLFWVTLGSILQEIIYRGYLMPKLEQITSFVLLIITANTILFLLPHLIYPELKPNMLLIFISGIMFATIYYYYPNLILISAMHMILNFVATSFGFFTFNPKVHQY